MFAIPDAMRSRELTPGHCMRCDYAAGANPPRHANPTTSERERATLLSLPSGKRHHAVDLLLSPFKRLSLLRGVVVPRSRSTVLSSCDPRPNPAPRRVPDCNNARDA